MIIAENKSWSHLSYYIMCLFALCYTEAPAQPVIFPGKTVCLMCGFFFLSLPFNFFCSERPLHSCPSQTPEAYKCLSLQSWKKHSFNSSNTSLCALLCEYQRNFIRQFIKVAMKTAFWLYVQRQNRQTQRNWGSQVCPQKLLMKVTSMSSGRLQLKSGA